MLSCRLVAMLPSEDQTTNCFVCVRVNRPLCAITEFYGSEGPFPFHLCRNIVPCYFDILHLLRLKKQLSERLLEAQDARQRLDEVMNLRGF